MANEVTSAATAVFDDDGALRAHLDALNATGVTPVVVGIDATPRAFLITLIGPYAESEDVLFDSPWQSDINYGEMVDGEWVPHAPRCDDCLAHVHDMEHLRFPVTVMLPPLTDQDRERYESELAELMADA